MMPHTVAATVRSKFGGEHSAQSDFVKVSAGAKIPH
jgi:hypothetical protein